MGIATGIAGLGAVFQSRVHAGLTEGLASVGGLGPGRIDAVAASVSSGGIPAGGAGPGGETIARVARTAFIDGLNELFSRRVAGVPFERDWERHVVDAVWRSIAASG